MIRKHLRPITPSQALFAFVLVLTWHLPPISASAGDFDRFKFKPSNRSAPDRNFNVPAAPQPAPVAPGEEAFEKGDAFFDAHDYQQALHWLEKAVNEAPDNTKYRNILARCRQAIARQQEEIQKQAERKELGRVAAKVKDQVLNQALNDARSNALDQLGSVAKSGPNAVRQRGDDIARIEAGCGFSHGLCATPDPIIIKLAQRGGADLPAVVALRDKIPQQFRNNEQVKQSFAWFTKLEVEKVDKQAQIAKIQSEIENGTAASGSQLFKENLEIGFRQLEAYQKKAESDIATITQVRVDK